jgi:hypothetical protein
VLAPAVPQCHPEPSADPCFRYPARSRPWTLLESQGQDHIATVDRPSNTRNSGGKVGTGTLQFVRAQQKMPQKLSPEHDVAPGAAGAGRNRQAGSVRGAKRPIEGSDSEHRGRCGPDRLDAELTCLLGAERGTPQQRRT